MFLLKRNCILVIIAFFMSVHTTISIRVCGSRLIRLVESICDHKLYRPTKVVSPYQNYGTHMMGRGRIVEECCYKKCTYLYLRSYCAQPETTTTQPTTTTTPMTVAEVKTFRSLFDLLQQVRQYLDKSQTNPGQKRDKGQNHHGHTVEDSKKASVIHARIHV